MIKKSYLDALISNKKIKDSKNFFESYKLRKDISKYDVFLSYSFNDIEYAVAIAQLLTNCGHTVYFDKKESDFSSPSRVTIERLTKIMDSCKSLLYVRTQSSAVSKWCPWELGYMSGKTNFRCATIPIVINDQNYVHQEYLKIYPRVSYGKTREGNFLFFVFNENETECITLASFIGGRNP